MPHIKIRKAQGTWVVRAGGAVLAETANALELNEGDHPAVIYFPRSDVAMAFLDISDQTTRSPHKGQANYYNIVTKSHTLENAGWSYEDPKPDVAAIKGYLAFHSSDTVTVEGI
ncbi:DUF427 domain-containing protein [Pseudohalocynthiibacter aestuariivivens]|uniref:DUF427 domain-containing protein n=1 Tax=Roseovarius pelagicus TaxID=2980108 RepID=A0ABY6DD96_9RHOB|nr:MULTISPECIES: DUF427 domain-containing protein [Rhodobacterales]QIE44061.1 DUF427 domain-containing protein [Pseudohalocynthiibacter aestuariivivens]UXX84040.1 DUF427 domain-containing protein [Roseovarius pelagicus]